ncbi:LLM class flavin-dependent oxidoreductase [Streptomyces sp. IB2014 016-6]|uniref:LLM class flavin-dependent oxidoreductase n=1 Tax=Streptomyces sp. IB2014 016-6 TaxID=2517818 RepID=UPI0011CCD4F1|nr:LLM class flavin-dependent oxidoreductase [Streptomyces sp. IB2014 016-6]TXL87710.1 LLM class flavin-dependent oxidoreductase [Streptomyces sp. IB2014 016-6]
MKTIWYVSRADGRMPWNPQGQEPLDRTRLDGLAREVEQAGFYGALIATWSSDALITSAFVAAATTRLRVLTALYANLIPPKLLAEQARAYNALTDGRLLFNLVNGRDDVLRSYGLDLSHDDRYAAAERYWKDFRQHYRADDFFGRALEAGDAVPGEDVPLWGAGDSAAGSAHAGAVLDGFLTMLRDSERTRDNLARAHAAASRHGRIFAESGIMAGIAIRRRREEALAHFYGMFEDLGPDVLAEQSQKAITRRTQGRASLRTFVAPDAKRQSWVDALNAGRLPTPAELHLYGSQYAGFAAWAPLDIFGDGAAAVYFVGDPDDIANDIKGMRAELGISALVLTGWPLREEAAHVGALLLPRLDAMDKKIDA